MADPRTGNIERQDSESEHIGPNETGDNISAKRVANYVWNGAGWERKASIPQSYTPMVDDTSTANTIYVGQALPGSSTASSVWQIKRLNTSSGIVGSWADGNALFDNVWDNRTSLTYV